MIRGKFQKNMDIKIKIQAPHYPYLMYHLSASSLALIMDDPDAKKVVGKTWTHWLVWNIKSDIAKFDESSIPNGCIQGMTDFG